MSLPAKRFDEIEQDRLRSRLQDWTEPQLRAALYKVVPHVRRFLIDTICEFASPQERRALLDDGEIADMKHDRHLGTTKE